MRLSPCNARTVQQDFKLYPPSCLYVAPSCLICALTTNSSTSEYEFFLDLSYRQSLTCMMTQRDIGVVGVHIHAHSRNAEDREIRFQLLNDLVERFDLAYESEDISAEISRLNLSLPPFETGRLVTTLDNGANWYLTRSIESIIPLEMDGRLRAQVLSERSMLLAFEEYEEARIQVVDPCLLIGRGQNFGSSPLA